MFIQSNSLDIGLRDQFYLRSTCDLKTSKMDDLDGIKMKKRHHCKHQSNNVISGRQGAS